LKGRKHEQEFPRMKAWISIGVRRRGGTVKVGV